MIDSNTSRYARTIGRVGALAVALGIGAGLAAAPWAVSATPPIAADTPNIGPSECIVDGGMAPDRCDANFIRDLNGIGVGTWSELDDGSPQRANVIEVGHHIVNFLDSSIMRAAKEGGGSADAQDIGNAFDATIQKAQGDSTRADRCAITVPNVPCTTNVLNFEQATLLVRAAIHWFGPPGMESVVNESLQEVRGGG